jgi:CRP-like cAMP-binding protein
VNASTLHDSLRTHLSAEGGFLPRQVPLDVLPGALCAYSDAVVALPEHFHGARCSARRFLADALGTPSEEALRALETEVDALDEAGLDKAFAVLSVLGHAWRWDRVPAPKENYALTELTLPAALDRPWARAAARFEVPRVGTLYSMVLCNWRLPGRAGGVYRNEEIESDRLVIAHPWLHGSAADELHCFLMTAVETEARGALAVRTIVDLVQAVEADSLPEVLYLLDRLLAELDALSRPFRNNIQRKKMSPDSFLTLIQPATIWGLPEGPGLPPLEGASGPQVGSVQCIDALLGAGHERPISQAILHTRRYLPARHRRFIADVEAAVPAVRAFLEKTHDPQARTLFNRCVEGIVGWRRIHEKRGAMYLRGDTAGDGAYASTGGVVALADERVRVFEQAMVARQEEVLAAALPVADLSADDELAHALPDLTAEDRDALLSGARHLALETDATLIQAGARREGLYLLRRGAVRVVRASHGENVVIARVVAGALFGEMSFFENEDASASVEAECPCDVELIPREHVYALFRGRVDFEKRFYQSLATLMAQRLRDTSRRLAQDTRRESRTWRFEAEPLPPADAARAARASGRAFCDALETLEAVTHDEHSLLIGVRQAGTQLLADTVALPAAEVVRHAWPRLSEAALCQALTQARLGGDAVHAELALRLAMPPEGRGPVGVAVDAWLRSLPTLAGFLALGSAVGESLAQTLAGRPADAPRARVLAVLPAFAPRLVEGALAHGAEVTLIHPEARVCEVARAAARRAGAAARLHLVPEPLARVRQSPVETFWRPFDVVVADSLLPTVDDDATEPLLDWLLALLHPHGTAFFGAAQPGAPDHPLLSAISPWPVCRRTDAEVLATFEETRAHDVRLHWYDAARAFCLVAARPAVAGT